jgi:hypothetical protein
MKSKPNYSIHLYTTSACHLCELAIDLLSSMNLQIPIIPIEIADDDRLVEKYGASIPVMCRSDNQSELKWPFNAIDIRIFLS